MTQKIIKVGTSSAVVLPKDTLAKLGLRVGDRVEVDLEKKRKEIIITPLKPEFSETDARVGKIALGIINRYRKDFENLAHK